MTTLRCSDAIANARAEWLREVVVFLSGHPNWPCSAAAGHFRRQLTQQAEDDGFITVHPQTWGPGEDGGLDG